MPLSHSHPPLAWPGRLPVLPPACSTGSDSRWQLRFRSSCLYFRFWLGILRFRSRSLCRGSTPFGDGHYLSATSCRRFITWLIGLTSCRANCLGILDPLRGDFSLGGRKEKHPDPEDKHPDSHKTDDGKHEVPKSKARPAGTVPTAPPRGKSPLRAWMPSNGSLAFFLQFPLVGLRSHCSSPFSFFRQAFPSNPPLPAQPRKGGIPTLLPERWKSELRIPFQGILQSRASKAGTFLGALYPDKSLATPGGMGFGNKSVH